MPKHLRVTLLILLAWALLIVFFLPGMRSRLARLASLGSRSVEELAQREVTRPPVADLPAAAKTKAKLFWATSAGDGVEPVEVELPLVADPAQRSRQLLEALIVRAPSKERRTLPESAAVLELYVLPDGTAVADFTPAVGASLPSGIRSEQLALDSITKTLAANVESLSRLKVLIQGQETETLAGHVDLTVFFELKPPVAPAPAPAPEKTPEGKARASR